MNTPKETVFSFQIPDVLLKHERFQPSDYEGSESTIEAIERKVLVDFPV